MIESWRDASVDGSYLIAALLFVVGLKMLANPTTARRGNQLAAGGMALAIVATLFSRQLEIDGAIDPVNMALIIGGIVIGAIISAWPSRRVPMTSMPQMVAIFNGMGGATVALVSVAEYTGHSGYSRQIVVAIVLGVIIGSLSFTGSVVAFLKLQELISGRPIVWAGQKLVNGLIFLGMTALGVAVVVAIDGDTARAMLLGVFALSMLLGALVVLPIGGADMPVVIAILNSFTGTAAAIAGLQLDNQALLVGGILVGASGSLLTLLMARAMNRSITNIIFGAFGSIASSAAGDDAGAEALPVREVTAEDASIQLAYAERVVIVPGYGLAVAQAQQQVRELADLLKERGVDVRYAIHPVAGRMPGHMNVLLAEANVAYDDLYEMDDINDDFPRTDVALVIGANDVVNPAARNDTSSPIYGMPILNVDQAQNVIVLKRGMSAGFAGIENELFHYPKTSMLFGDARASLNRLIVAVKEA
ncbi:MAG TPA: NAD(P)(+) transhydrogenase (Re/Si-specific) subunit beta [Thermomicrobiales bacterium]|nr:NAD(P)(+) transhydrogenase (Re/Si-specific) subunit beta [Thermomicrobiales bacterium]